VVAAVAAAVLLRRHVESGRGSGRGRMGLRDRQETLGWILEGHGHGRRKKEVRLSIHPDLLRMPPICFGPVSGHDRLAAASPRIICCQPYHSFTDTPERLARIRFRMPRRCLPKHSILHTPHSTLHTPHSTLRRRAARFTPSPLRAWLLTFGISGPSLYSCGYPPIPPPSRRFTVDLLTQCRPGCFLIRDVTYHNH
jgi:hypothetical protein